MSKKCPKCGSKNIHLATTVPNALCLCFECRHQWKAHYKPRKKKELDRSSEDERDRG